MALNVVQNRQFVAGETVTPAKLNDIASDVTITGIPNSSLDTITTVGKVSGAALTLLTNVPSGALKLPTVNLNTDTTGVVLGNGSVNPTNLLYNGDFESWSAGTAVAPDGWSVTANSTPPTAVQEASIIKLGLYSIKLTSASTSQEGLTQVFHTTRGINYWKGRKITVGCWVRTSTASRVRIAVYDDIDADFSSFHTGDSNWQWLTATRTISNSATLCGVSLGIDPGTSCVAYFDGAIAVEGESAFAFSDKPAEEGVWADYSGISTIVGWNSSGLTKGIWIKKIGKIVFVNFGFSGTSNSTLINFTLPYVSSATSDYYFPAFCADNGSTKTSMAYCSLTAGSSTVNAYLDFSPTAWTNTGSKQIFGQFWYEAV